MPNTRAGDFSDLWTLLTGQQQDIVTGLVRSIAAPAAHEAIREALEDKGSPQFSPTARGVLAYLELERQA